MEDLNRMSRSELLEYVTIHTNELDLLVALAEEAAELSKAALKLARARKYVNHPTPLSSEEAFKDLIEECTDVKLCVDALAIDFDPNLLQKKTLRWAKRLERAADEQKED